MTSFFHKFRLLFKPVTKTDPDFGQIVFMYIWKNPENSYWECDWNFPNTGMNVSITLPGDEAGPFPESREFFLKLPAGFDEILNQTRPKLQAVFREWLNQTLPENIFTEVKLAGFDLEDARVSPIQWNVSFETLGDKWLGITIPFLGNIPQDAIVDS